MSSPIMPSVGNGSLHASGYAKRLVTLHEESSKHGPAEVQGEELVFAGVSNMGLQLYGM